MKFKNRVIFGFTCLFITFIVFVNIRLEYADNVEITSSEYIQVTKQLILIPDTEFRALVKSVMSDSIVTVGELKTIQNRIDQFLLEQCRGLLDVMIEKECKTIKTKKTLIPS